MSDPGVQSSARILIAAAAAAPLVSADSGWPILCELELERAVRTVGYCYYWYSHLRIVCAQLQGTA